MTVLHIGERPCRPVPELTGGAGLTMRILIFL